MMNPVARVATALCLKCPRCREGKLFTGLLKMNEACPQCGLKLEPEPGFYLGSIYANYAVTVVTATAAFLVLVYVCGFNKDVVIWSCTAFTVLFPVWFFRYARSIWLSLMYLVSSSDFSDPLAVGEPQPVALRSHSE
jgi:uncharacterized protein (DUF983 family)